MKPQDQKQTYTIHSKGMNVLERGCERQARRQAVGGVGSSLSQLFLINAIRLEGCSEARHKMQITRRNNQIENETEQNGIKVDDERKLQHKANTQWRGPRAKDDTTIGRTATGPLHVYN